MMHMGSSMISIMELMLDCLLLIYSFKKECVLSKCVFDTKYNNHFRYQYQELGQLGRELHLNVSFLGSIVDIFPFNQTIEKFWSESPVIQNKHAY